MDAPTLTMMQTVPYLICLLLPIFTFLLVALYKERRKYKLPIYYGFVAAIILSILIYIFLPIIIIMVIV